MRQLLSDVRVVDLSDEPAGAYATKVFADLGADVVKVEPPGGGELRRRRPRALLHLDTNKRAVVADVTSDAGRRRVAWLLEHADVVVESPGSGDLAALGVDRDELRGTLPEPGRHLHQRLRRQRPVLGLPLVRPGRADRRLVDLPARTFRWSAGEDARHRRPVLDRSHRRTRGARRRVALRAQPAKAPTSTVRRPRRWAPRRCGSDASSCGTTAVSRKPRTCRAAPAPGISSRTACTRVPTATSR